MNKDGKSDKRESKHEGSATRSTNSAKTLNWEVTFLGILQD